MVNISIAYVTAMRGPNRAAAVFHGCKTYEDRRVPWRFPPLAVQGREKHCELASNMPCRVFHVRSSVPVRAWWTGPCDLQLAPVYIEPSGALPPVSLCSTIKQSSLHN